MTPEEFLQEAQGEAATGAAAAATEHSGETTSLPAEKQMIYSIVTALLNNKFSTIRKQKNPGGSVDRGDMPSTCDTPAH